MNTPNSNNRAASTGRGLEGLVRNAVNQRGRVFGWMIVGGAIAFEIFNFSTTQYSLKDVLGDLSFLGISWATILAIAFCSIDFAGIAKLFMPDNSVADPTQVWYLFGAWVLGAAFNATLTWWGVSVAIAEHTGVGEKLMGGEMKTLIPIFIAVLVWVIRICLIGTFSSAGDRIFASAGISRPVLDQSSRQPERGYQPAQQTQTAPARPMRPVSPAGASQPQQKTTYRPIETNQSTNRQPGFTPTNGVPAGPKSSYDNLVGDAGEYDFLGNLVGGDEQ